MATLVALGGCEAQTAGAPIVHLPPEPRLIEAGAPEIQVLPFTVRMSKLAHVLARPIDDPVFDALYQQRYALGDHDYARALRPDRRWGARRIAIWVRGLLPVCESPRFAELYPAAAVAPEALILKAYGRPPEAADLETLAAIAPPAGSAHDRDTLACLAILSSLEFVAQ